MKKQHARPAIAKSPLVIIFIYLITFNQVVANPLALYRGYQSARGLYLGIQATKSTYSTVQAARSIYKADSANWVQYNKLNWENRCRIIGARSWVARRINACAAAQCILGRCGVRYTAVSY